MAYVDGYDLHRMRETGRGAPSSDPNMMAWTTKYQAEWGGGKRELGQAVQKRLNAMEDARWPPRPTTKLCPPPKPIQPREGVNAGMRHYGPTESTYTELPLSIHGRTWDKKRHVLDANGNMLLNLQSGQNANYFGLFGSIRRFDNPEQCRTHSHKELLFATPESVAGEIKQAGGPGALHICDEWEKTIMKTQGIPSKHIPFPVAMKGRWGEMKQDMHDIHGYPAATAAHTIQKRMDATRGARALAAAPTPRALAASASAGALAAMSGAQKDARIAELQSTLRSMKSSRGAP